MPHYSKNGKITAIMSSEDFKNIMEHGEFKKKRHRSFFILLYYTGVRLQEGIRVKREQFKRSADTLYFDVGTRLKNGLTTAPLPLPLSLPYLNELIHAIRYTKKGERVFPYCKRTGYNIIARVCHYPHYLRLNRITQFFQEGYNIAQVKNWTGHKTLKGLEPYIGLADINEMGKSLA